MIRISVEQALMAAMTQYSQSVQAMLQQQATSLPTAFEQALRAAQPSRSETGGKIGDLLEKL